MNKQLWANALLKECGIDLFDTEGYVKEEHPLWDIIEGIKLSAIKPLIVQNEKLLADIDALESQLENISQDARYTAQVAFASKCENERDQWKTLATQADEKTLRVMEERDHLHEKLNYFEETFCASRLIERRESGIQQAVDPEKVRVVIEERDQLRAENEKLKTHPSHLDEKERADKFKQTILQLHDHYGCAYWGGSYVCRIDEALSQDDAIQKEHSR